MTYEIPGELKSEVKIFRSIYFFDLVVALVAIGFASITSSAIYPPIVLAYYIFVTVSTLFLLAKSPCNPGKRNYKTIHLLFTKDNNPYYKVEENVSELILYDNKYKNYCGEGV